MSGRTRAEQFGPYLVYEQLGQGGMAVVHRAEQTGIEGFRKVVALKRMLPNVAANDDMVRAFVREARLASFLRHGNVAQTYELGKVDDIYFIAMELVEGRNLREVLRRLAHNGSSMPVPIALNIVNQICDALDYAHNLTDDTGQPLGIIHRDVSPANVIVSDEGTVKLIDFGIAKASAAGMQTMSGTIKGKYGYMAPEYLQGRIDARADLFAVGVIAHELLTNRPLFSTNDDMKTLMRVRELQIEPPSRSNPKVPREIDEIVMTALERDPDRRWQHATALRNAMTTVTRRVGMEVVNQVVVEWLDTFDFDRATEPVVGRTKSPAYIDEFADDQSMVISVEANTAFTVNAMPPQPMPLGSQPPPDELSKGGRDRAEYQAAVAIYERQSVPSGQFDVPTLPTTPRTITPTGVAGLASQTGRTTGPTRTLMGVEARPSRPHDRVPSAQMPATPVRSSADMPATRSAEISVQAAPVPVAAPAKTAPKGSSGILVMLLVLVLIGGGAVAAYVLL